MKAGSRRIASNTLIMYVRQAIILGVSLYTVRAVLNILGVFDYGVFSIVGGVVALFSFLTGTMASATQRFFSFALGEQDRDKMSRILLVNGAIYLAIAVIAFALLETVGLWFVQQHLNIPEGRYDAVQWVYQFSIYSFIVTILSAPLIALIVSYEDLHIFAYVSGAEAVLKLGIVYLLTIAEIDKLVAYSALGFIVCLLISCVYVWVCLANYSETKVSLKNWDKNLFFEVINFTGWTLFGQVSTVARTQAVTILLNQTFNPAVVAARAIAMNVTNQINQFSNNFNSGLYPPIIKAYASGDRTSMFSLVFVGSRIAFYLMWIISLPLIVEMDFILDVWLKSPPPGAALFTRLALVEALFFSVSTPIATAARAPGKMMAYELTLGSIQFAVFVASWFVLSLGAPAYSVFVVAIVANVVMFFVRIMIVNGLIGLPIAGFASEAMAPILSVASASSMAAIAFAYIFDGGALSSMISVVLSVCVAGISISTLGLTAHERNKIIAIISSRLGFKGSE